MPFKKITLDNGLRVILVPEEDSFSTTVLVLVEAGSKYETKDINGLSHFLEHMCFKGTERRPRAIDIASGLDGIGASYNAFTSQEYTGYYAKAVPRHLGKILDVVSDIYLNQVFKEEEINKERGVIIEEINMYEDLPMRRVQELFLNLLYGDQPAGWDIAGRKEIIQKLSREDFLKYRGEHYLAKSSIVVVSGKFDEGIVGEIERNFGGIRSGGKTPKIETVERQEKPEILLKQKATDQLHLVLGVRAFDIFDERKYAGEILAEILGGGMSSRLFQKIRNEMGAAYYVRADTDLFTDHGYLSASAGIDQRNLEKVIEVILNEFKNLSQKSIDREELEKAKEHLVGNMMLGLETSDSLAGFYGAEEVITKKLITPQELAQKIRAVTPEEVQAVAKDIFKNEKLNLAVIGPFEDKARLERVFSL